MKKAGITLFFFFFFSGCSFISPQEEIKNESAFSSSNNIQEESKTFEREDLEKINREEENLNFISSSSLQESKEEEEENREQNEEISNDPLVQLVKSQQSLYDKTGKFSLEIAKNSETEVLVSLFLLNPKKEKITSLQSWISYPSKILEGKLIELKTDVFPLSAPGEKDFDKENGLIKIGLSTEKGETREEEKIHIADISFLKKSTGFATLEFFHPGEEGKTKIMALKENDFRDILKKESIKPLIISNTEEE